VEIDYNAWRFWIGVGSLIFNMLIAAYLWFSRKHQATIKMVEKAVTSLGNRIDANEKGLLEVQTELKFIPTQRQLQRLNTNMGTLEGELKEVKGRLEGINRVADLMNEYLINREKL